MLARIILALVAVGWAWEVGAILFDAWPTITDVVRAQRDRPLVVYAVTAVIIAAATWVIAHFWAVRR